VRELKNIAEQISVLSTDKNIDARKLQAFLHTPMQNLLPAIIPSNGKGSAQEFANEREILYKLFFDMKKDVTELKRMMVDILQNPGESVHNSQLINKLNEHQQQDYIPTLMPAAIVNSTPQNNVQLDHSHELDQHEVVEESLNIMDVERDLIKKALKKHKGKRKDASMDLGISERTLYRKLKEYEIED